MAKGTKGKTGGDSCEKIANFDFICHIFDSWLKICCDFMKEIPNWQDEKAPFTCKMKRHLLRNFEISKPKLVMSVSIYSILSNIGSNFYDSFSNVIQPFSVANLKNYIFSINLL